MNLVLALLLYPGIALTLALTLIFGWLTEGRIVLDWFRSAAWTSFDGLVSIASMLLAAFALALLPWPQHPAATWNWLSNPVMLWITLEGAFLLPILPGLLAPSPLGARAASRESQLSSAGRSIIWLSIGIALWGNIDWSTRALLGRVLLLLAGLMALPAAFGIGPFAAERSLNAAGAEEGLDEATARLVRFTRNVRGTVLLAALLVTALPRAAGDWTPALNGEATPVQPWIALIMFGALFIIITLLLRQTMVRLPRITLPSALRWCWWRALPLALVSIIYLLITNP